MDQALPIHRSAAASEKSRLIDALGGLFAPLCLFVEPGNLFFLTTADAYEVDRFAVPISLVLSPIFLLFIFHRRFHQYLTGSAFLLLLGLFVTYCIVMGTLNAVLVDGDAILYAYQWVMPFIWLPYCLTIIGTPRFEKFAKWFTVGVIINLGWYASSGLVEYMFYGGLGDAGRMTQNLVLPGQYQIAVYVPTTIAISISMVNGLYFAKQFLLKGKWMLVLNFAAFIVLLALASREGLLTYLLATLLLYAVRSPYLRAALLFGGLIVGALVIVNLNAIFETFAASDLRMLNKIATLQDEHVRFGGRDLMIRESIKVFLWDPLFGSRFLPPNVSVFGDGVIAPSAHNMYVDAFVWCGLFGGLMFLAICARLLFGAINMIVTRNEAIPPYMKFFGVVLIVFLLVSNNTNVPMRQPVIGPALALMMAAMLHHSMIRRKSAS